MAQQPTPFPDTVHFLDAANVSARHFRAVYLAYLMITFYTIVIISTTSDELLFRAGNVQMPIINTNVSVEGLFTFASWILFLPHCNVLIQAMLLSTKVHRYTSALDNDRHIWNLDEEKTHARGLLFPAPLAHVLAKGGPQQILRIFVFIIIVLLSPGILIYTEIHLLTYQSESITWRNRTVILLDILLLWCLWPRIIAPDKSWKEWWKQSPRKRWAATFISMATGFFVIVIADIPGGTMENLILPNSLYDWREHLGRRYQLESRTLVQEEPPPEILAAHLAACKSQNPDDQADCQTEIKPGSPIWCQHAKPLSLQKRAFRRADLRGTILCGVDLSIDLSGADLSWAKLHGAYLRYTDLKGTDPSYAELQGTYLINAELQGAILRYAKLQGAILLGAELQGVDLSYAELQGADLSYAELQGAILRYAELQGADLSYAELQNADLSYAKLQGTDLRRAYLAGSDLSNADLNLADLRDVDLASKPDQKQLQKVIATIKSIKQQAFRDQALELAKRAEKGDITIAPSSIEDAIFSEGSALYTQLQESENRALLQTDHFTQTKEEDYDTKLAAYLIDSLSCGYKDNYVAEGIIRYRILEDESRKLASIFAKKLNLDSKAPSLLCQGVEKPLDRLSEYDRTELREIFAESANQ